MFTHFPSDTKYFGDGFQHSIVNFRVDEIDQLLAQLTTAEVRVDPKRDDYPYGRFAWIWDPEGNRIEPWQPPPAKRPIWRNVRNLLSELI